MFKAITIRTAVFLLFVLALCTSGTVASTMLDYDTYLASDFSDIHTVLDGMTGVNHDTDASWYQAAGFITFNAAMQSIMGVVDVPAGTPVWAITESDHQVVGFVKIGPADGYYSFSGGYGIFGDGPGSSDAGAVLGEQLIVAAAISGNYYSGSFVTGPLVSGYAEPDPPLVLGNIEITDTILPEPAALALLAAGGIGLLLRRRRRA
jgi:hypothetical protein